MKNTLMILLMLLTVSSFVSCNSGGEEGPMEDCTVTNTCLPVPIDPAQKLEGIYFLGGPSSEYRFIRTFPNTINLPDIG